MMESTTASSLGHQFATALSAKDYAQITELLDPAVDFRALTPRRVWEAGSPAEVDAIVQQWFDADDHLDELLAIDEGEVADRRRVAYRFRGHNADGSFVVEQQAYYTQSEGRIDWMRVLCSGFRFE